jgi:hypothetical protein
MLRGRGSATSVVAYALEVHPRSWRLPLVSSLAIERYQFVGAHIDLANHADRFNLDGWLYFGHVPLHEINEAAEVHPGARAFHTCLE